MSLLLGVALFVVGVVAVGVLPWFAWAEIGLGLLSFFFAGTQIRWGPVDFFALVLGLASAVLTAIAVALGLGGTIIGWTAGIAVAFLLGAAVDAVVVGRNLRRGS